MKTLIILALLLLPVVAFAEHEKPQEKRQVCAERIVVARAQYDQQCLENCGAELGICIGSCDTEDCMSSCEAAQGRCASRCLR